MEGRDDRFEGLNLSPSEEGFGLWRHRNADRMGTKGWSGLYWARPNAAGDYPHLLSLEDAPAKAVGLAEYADKHWPEFGRIELIIMENDELKRLDLTDEGTRNKVRGVQTHEHLRQLYRSGTG